MIDLAINGTSKTLEDDDLTVEAYPQEGDRCAHCGDPIAEYVDGWQHDSTGAHWCHDLTDAEAADTEGATGATRAEAVPGNWAGITLNPSEESMRVEISVGDPRGCFTMTVRRVRDDDGAERLILHVPHPDDSTPHARLTEIAPGTYQIGG